MASSSGTMEYFAGYYLPVYRKLKYNHIRQLDGDDLLLLSYMEYRSKVYPSWSAKGETGEKWFRFSPAFIAKDCIGLGKETQAVRNRLNTLVEIGLLEKYTQKDQNGSPICLYRFTPLYRKMKPGYDKDDGE